MRKFFLIPFLFLFNSQVISEIAKDPKILCIRSQTAYDISFKAAEKHNEYTDIMLEAYVKEKKKFEDRGEIFTDWSEVDEPYKSIKKEFDVLSNLRLEKRHAYAKTLVPILELAGYERPEFYLWYYTSSMWEIQKKHKMVDLLNFEPYLTAQEYFSHTGSGNDTRDKLCKLYGFEFNNRSNERFNKKFGL